MKLAREQGALYEIERLTFRKALEEFDNLRRKNLVDRQALIFINSIASVCLRREDSEYMDQRWHELRRQMVIEITEEEEMNRQALESKRHAPGFSGMFALDDYGSGYSNEGSLLELAPGSSRWISASSAALIRTPTSSRSCATWCATPSRAACRSLPRVWKRPPRCAPSSTWGPTCCRATSWRGRPLCRPHCPGGSGDHPSDLGQQPPEALLNRPKEQEIPYRTGISCSFYTVRNAIWRPANLPLVFGRALRYTGVERKTAREVL